MGHKHTDTRSEASQHDHFQRRISALRTERESFIPHYMDLAEFIQPRRGRFFIQDRNKGTKVHSSIINSHATFAHQTTRSGMMAGTMSPAHPWFDLKTFDPKLNEFQPVKDWLFDVTRIIRDIFSESNFYNQAPVLLGELILFGTGCMSHVDDFDNVARFYTHTAGSYLLGQDERLKINTLGREFEWTTSQIVSEFGRDNCSPAIQNAYDRGDYDNWFKVTHLTEPNPDYKRGKRGLSKNKRFLSVYFEPGEVGLGKHRYLSTKGFDAFPAYCPRWDVTGEDIYGTDCPAMTALGDIKGLQIEEKRKAQGIDKMVNPPLQGPASLRGTGVSSLPGGLNLYEINEKGHKLSSVYDVNIQLGELRLDMNAVEARIDRAFYVDMFLAISRMEGIQPKNELDLMSRNEERLLMLGPVLERLQGEFHDELIDRVFNQGMKAGIFPPVPEELENRPLRIKYISTLAMAQRAVATQSIDRAAAFVGNLGEMWPHVLDKFDADQAVDEYSLAIGTPPRIIKSDDIVQAERQQRAEAQQQAQAMEQAKAMAGALKDVAGAKTGDDSVLTDVLEAAGG